MFEVFHFMINMDQGTSLERRKQCAVVGIKIGNCLRIILRQRLVPTLEQINALIFGYIISVGDGRFLVDFIV